MRYQSIDYELSAAASRQGEDLIKTSFQVVGVLIATTWLFYCTIIPRVITLLLSYNRVIVAVVVVVVAVIVVITYNISYSII